MFTSHLFDDGLTVIFEAGNKDVHVEGTFSFREKQQGGASWCYG